jgi:multiple sugar transport system ATP-binding protein
MASVTLHGVEKFFGTVKVIHGVDIAIADGEFVVLVGPSGCGKSTLLRMIAGLEEASAGTISIGERTVNDVSPRDRDVAMVFQNYALYPHKTVYENMGFGLKLRKADRKLIEERVKRAADILGLGELLQRYPRQLSGGQRQRVAMGRAIVREPQAFLFDEPLSNLDAKLRVQMRTEIRSLHQKLRTTSIYVTHDQVEAMTMADRIVVLQDGRVAQIGAPIELYDRPANLFVAGFIGSPTMNVLTGTLKRSNGTAWVETDNSLRLPLPPSAPGAEGQKVAYGVRPEHFALSNAPEAIAANVEVVEQTGIDVLVFARFNGAPLCGLFRERHGFTPGQPIRLMPQLDAVHLFDAKSGERVRAG